MRYFLIALCVVGIPVLMIALSLGLPAARNPLFLLTGALVGFILSSYWLSRRNVGL